MEFRSPLAVELKYANAVMEVLVVSKSLRPDLISVGGVQRYYRYGMASV